MPVVQKCITAESGSNDNASLIPIQTTLRWKHYLASELKVIKCINLSSHFEQLDPELYSQKVMNTCIPKLLINE